MRINSINFFFKNVPNISWKVSTLLVLTLLSTACFHGDDADDLDGDGFDTGGLGGSGTTSYHALNYFLTPAYWSGVQGASVGNVCSQAEISSSSSLDIQFAVSEGMTLGACPSQYITSNICPWTDLGLSGITYIPSGTSESASTICANDIN